MTIPVIIIVAGAAGLALVYLAEFLDEFPRGRRRP